MKKYILGLNYIGHDASASLLRDGEILASAMEERFSRVKHDRNFPMRAIQFCLRQGGISIKDVDVITYHLIPKLHFDEKVIHHLGKYYPKSVPLFENMLNRGLAVNNVEKEIREKLGYLGEIYFCDHHSGHISSAFFGSTFKSAAAISVDGLGEIASLVVATVNEESITKHLEIKFPHSLGMLYSSVTHYAGFNATQDPGKVMGLASYGDPEKYIDAFRKMVLLKDDGGFELDLDYFEFPFQRDLWISQKFLDTFGPRRMPEDPMTKHYEDVAAALQKRLEEVMFHVAEHAARVTGEKNLCIAGGVALNSVANGKILQNGYFQDIFIPPAAGDDGLSMGCPLYYNHYVLKNKERFPLVSPYLGTEYSDKEIEQAIKKFSLEYRKSEDVCKETAELIAENNIIGWFQGRMEVGPRALGNRSILANPAKKDVKEELNARVKFREPFRPFAPSILIEDVKDWFVYDYPAPFMLLVFDVKPDKRTIIPGVTHVDGSGRLQTVSKELNPKYYRLISEFKKLTNVPIVVNTSFNIKGEPIIESPVDAIRCFLGNGIDYLVLNDYIIKKHQ